MQDDNIMDKHNPEQSRKYPEYALQELALVALRLDREFSRVWGVLSPSVERDTVMYHLFSAKKALNEILGGNK